MSLHRVIMHRRVYSTKMSKKQRLGDGGEMIDNDNPIFGGIGMHRPEIYRTGFGWEEVGNVKNEQECQSVISFFDYTEGGGNIEVRLLNRQSEPRTVPDYAIKICPNRRLTYLPKILSGDLAASSHESLFIPIHHEWRDEIYVKVRIWRDENKIWL